MSIQCFWHGFPDSHLEFGPAVVWPHEGSNGDFRIHMQNGFSDLGFLQISTCIAYMYSMLVALVALLGAGVGGVCAGGGGIF